MDPRELPGCTVGPCFIPHLEDHYGSSDFIDPGLFRCSCDLEVVMVYCHHIKTDVHSRIFTLW